MSTVVEVKDLVKRYGDLTAVNGVSLSIDGGEIFGILGPNGAGKTTTVEMIEGLRKPDSGSIRVCGIDSARGAEKIKQLVGVQLQSTSIYERIKVGEAIELFGSYYHKSHSTSRVLDEVSLHDKADSFVETLSGGQKQRLALALAIVNDPQVLILDEPTTGLDPQARRNVWGIVLRLKEEGKTIILTTHYMEEAERLCDRVGIMDHGRIIALDATRRLIEEVTPESAIELTSPDEGAEEILGRITGVSKLGRDGDEFILHTREAWSVIKELTRLCDEKKLSIESVSMRKTTLEDVFLSLTGRKLRE